MAKVPDPRATGSAGTDLRDPDEFNEAAYLAANPDVATGVANGLVASGHAHYLSHGRAEGRRLSRIGGAQATMPDAAGRRPAADLIFGVGGNLPFKLPGFSTPEKDFRWMHGLRSEIPLPPLRRVPYLLELHLAPFTHPEILPQQRLHLRLGGIELGVFQLTQMTILACRIPTDAIPEAPPVLVLDHPDARSPRSVNGTDDQRPLALAVRRLRLWENMAAVLPETTSRPPIATLTGASPEDMDAGVRSMTGLSAAELMLHFESVGQNCEFGLVQRECGAEPLGLLRFSSSFLHNVVRGIDDGFRGMGDVTAIHPFLAQPHAGRREWMVREQTYNLEYHTGSYESDMSIEELKKREGVRLAFLKRKFLEELHGSKLFVCTRPQPLLTEAEILPLYVALRQHGPRTALLWIQMADADHPAGTVESSVAGVFTGYIDRFAPADDAQNFSFAAWLNICVNAFLLRQTHGPGG